MGKKKKKKNRQQPITYKKNPSVKLATPSALPVLVSHHPCAVYDIRQNRHKQKIPISPKHFLYGLLDMPNKFNLNQLTDK